MSNFRKLRDAKKKGDFLEEKDFLKTVHTFLELLGRDMDSANPSRDKDVLMTIREALFRTEIVGQLFGLTKNFRELLIKHFPEETVSDFNREIHLALAKDLVKLSVQAPSGKLYLYDLLRKFGADMENTQIAIFAITQFIELVRKLPMKFFTDPDVRLQIIATSQNELDELIVREEAEGEELVEDTDE